MCARRLCWPLLVISLLAASFGGPVSRVRASGLPFTDGDLPPLPEFVLEVSNSDGSQLRGVYAPQLFAYPIVQQPAGYPNFISRGENALTQFGSASAGGSIGLLAHNYLAGRDFPLLGPGQFIYLVYGDGDIETFVVTQMLRYRALQPRSTHSDFEDLQGGGIMDAETLFHAIYRQAGTLIFQTCIAENGSSTWGRLFVIAYPYEYPGITPQR